MLSAKLPPVRSGSLKLRLRSVAVEGPEVTLELPLTDHRIIVGQHCDYLIGNGVAHAFSKEGLYILSGPVPTILKELHTLGDATNGDGHLGP
jgi:hypothetical protein